MGTELRIYNDFHWEANKELTDKEFKIYLAMMRRVFFKPGTNIPENGSVVEYTLTIARNDGIKISKTGFKNIMDSLVKKNYIIVFKKGYFSGKHLATHYRLKKF